MLKNTLYDEFINRVRDESDIVNIVSEYVSLQKKGKNFWGCCPFHHEKTPSFSVAPDKGFFYCFGCQSGGDVFQFLMKTDHIGFMEAVSKVAQQLHIPFPEKEKSAAELMREKEIIQLYRINEMARDFYHNCLTKTSYGKGAVEYLLNRGITQQAIETFKLGFAPPGWDKLSVAFTDRGIDSKLLAKAGLTSQRPSGDGSYDRFRNRIMFPISDRRGRIIGFGGRVMDDSQPKYLNSPETVLFNKRHTLFAYSQACKSIAESGQAIVAEGYMDAITAFDAGITNVVASLGTAFTPEQGRILQKQAKEIIFAYDSDAAGMNATLRALEVVRSLGLTVRVATIPDGKDPDEFIRRNGAESFRRLVAQAPGLMDYQIRQALDTTEHSRLEGKVGVIAKILPSLSQLNNAVEIDGYITKLSQMLAIDENAIRSEYQKHAFQNKKDKYVKQGKTGYTSGNMVLSNHPVKKNNAAEQFLIRVMVEDKGLIPYVKVQLMAEDFLDERRREIVKTLWEADDSSKPVIAAALTASLSDKAGIELSQIMVKDNADGDASQLVDDCIKTVKLTSLRNLYEKHRLRADELERLGDSRFQQELAESKRINDEIKQLLQL